MKKRRYNKMVPEYLDESLDFKERAEDPYLISRQNLGYLLSGAYRAMTKGI